jgi:hypothetical protein
LSIFDVFSRFTAALKTWFTDWLAIPVCSYFYLPQPASAQLIHAAMMLSRWVRVAGPSAVRLSCAGNTALLKDATIPRQPIPAFSGVPACPDLSLPQRSVSASISAVSAQALNTLRAQVLAQPGLHVDIFGILDAMVVRFEAAKKEMAASQGVVWENDTWDLAAEQIKMKKVRVQKWCETIAIVAGEGRNRLTDTSNVVGEGGGETTNMLGGQGIGDLEWLVSNSDQDNRQWEIDLFDEMMGDIHTGVLLDTSGGWDIGVLDDMY